MKKGFLLEELLKQGFGSIRFMNKIQKIVLPVTTCPEQIIFEKRDDGFYNMTTKIHVVDPDDDESKIKTAYAKCVVELPKWVYGGIPVEVVQQDNVLYTIEVSEDEE